MIYVDVTCPICGCISTVCVPVKNYAKYRQGALVQDAFPDMTIVEREKLISGMCDKCQTMFFGSAA